MATNPRKKLAYFVILTVMLAVWATLVFYPWPKAPYEGMKNTGSTRTGTRPLQRNSLRMSLALTPKGRAELTITNSGAGAGVLVDCPAKSAFTVLITDANGVTHRKPLGIKQTAGIGTTTIELLPATSYVRSFSLLTILAPYRVNVTVAVAYQPGEIDRRFALPEEITSNTVTWFPLKGPEPRIIWRK